jgi:threonine synthase
LRIGPDVDISALTLGEGNTPLREDVALAHWAGVDRLYLKREDLNPTGSHKDRGAVVQIAACLERGQQVAVISSSGNAALAAATYGTRGGVTVVALISPRTEPVRVVGLREAGARVVITEKPINFGIRLTRVRGWPDLRPSQSGDAVTGFRGLGGELAAELREPIPVFGYASSGATFQALGEVFREGGVDLPLHPVQAGLVNGISKEFGRPGDGRRSLVGDLGVKVSDRAASVTALVNESGGQAWWVGDEDIAAAGETLRAQRYEVAPECWAALAGLRLAASEGGIGSACLLLTGRAVSAPVDALDSHEELGPGMLRRPVSTWEEVLALVADLT